MRNEDYLQKEKEERTLERGYRAMCINSSTSVVPSGMGKALLLISLGFVLAGGFEIIPTYSLFAKIICAAVALVAAYMYGWFSDRAEKETVMSVGKTIERMENEYEKKIEQKQQEIERPTSASD
ncbi:MAG: hypothetical protein RR365_06400 [Bacteroides sp.]